MNYEFTMSDETTKATASSSNPHDVLKFFSNEDIMSELRTRSFSGYITTDLKLREVKDETTDD